MNIICIYRIQSVKKPSRFYIGSTEDYYRRKADHLGALRINKHHSKYLQRHYNKHGASDLSFTIVEIVDSIENLIKKEQHYLDLLSPPFNSCKIAGRTTGIKLSKEVRDHLSKIRKGRPAWNKGMSGLPKQSEATRNKRRQALLGRPSPMKGRKHSQATIDKLSIPIIQLSKKGEFIKEWPSAKAASIELKIYAGNISSCAKGKEKSAGKFKWKYKTN